MTELLTLQQLSKRLRIPATWLRMETAAGRIPYLETSPGRRLFNPEAVAVAAVLAC